MISVIVPVYNVKPYVSRCIDSILKQTYTDIEILLIDDGSTDGSGIICEEYSKTDTRVHVIHIENHGVSYARNIGMENSNGEYIAFIDADDWIESNMFTRLSEALEKADADIAICKEKKVIEKADGSYEYNFSKRWQDISQDTLIDKTDLYNKVYIENGVVWNKLFRRAAIKEIRFDVNLHYGEDFIFLLDVLECTKNAVIVPDELYFYYVNRKGNVVSSIDERSLELISNGIRAYNILKKRGYTIVGVRRLQICVLQIALRLSKEQDLSSYKKYIKACTCAARIPSNADLIFFIRSDLIPWKNKVWFIGCRCSAKIMIKLIHLLH